MFELNGKVAVVTGSSRGIGAAIAKTFARSGAKVAISSTNEAACALVAGEIRRAGGDAFAMQCDVSKERQVRLLVEKTVEKYGSLDILVNNAGIIEYKALNGTSLASWRRSQSVNLDGVFFATKLAVPYMKRQRWGRIINLSSVAGIRSHAVLPAYSAAKFGVIGFTQAIAGDLGKYGITANAICPGRIETKMTEAFLKNKKNVELFLESLPIKRLGTPQDVANAALFLASEEAGYITGTSLVVDGGWTSQLQS